MDDPRNYDFPPGFGTAFVEFTSFTEARRARRCVHLAKYGKNMVECSYWDEGRFEREEFCGEELVKIEKPSGDFEGIEKFAIDFNFDSTVK